MVGLRASSRLPCSSTFVMYGLQRALKTMIKHRLPMDDSFDAYSSGLHWLIPMRRTMREMRARSAFYDFVSMNVIGTMSLAQLQCVASTDGRDRELLPHVSEAVFHPENPAVSQPLAASSPS